MACALFLNKIEFHIDFYWWHSSCENPSLKWTVVARCWCSACCFTSFVVSWPFEILSLELLYGMYSIFNMSDFYWSKSSHKIPSPKSTVIAGVYVMHPLCKMLYIIYCLMAFWIPFTGRVLLRRCWRSFMNSNLILEKYDVCCHVCKKPLVKYDAPYFRLTDYHYGPGIHNLYVSSFRKEFRMSALGVWNGACFRAGVASWWVGPPPLLTM